MQRLWSLPFAVALVASGLTMAPTPAEASTASTSSRVVRYGPYTIPAATSDSPGRIENQLRLAVQRPCADCYITSFTPNLVYADGTPATIETDAMLHHFVLASQFQRDATCGNSLLGLLGQRFFASGDERTVASFPSGYGYRVRWYDSWNLLADLMNMSASPQTVYVEVTFTVRPFWESVRPVRPVWLDIDQCGDSEYSIPAGESETTWDWSVNVPGTIVTMLGHLHGHGVHITATNESLGGALICDSVATLGTDPHHVEAMSTCEGDPVAVVEAGQTVRLHSFYNSSHPADDVMGIMLAYIRPSS